MKRPGGIHTSKADRREQAGLRSERPEVRLRGLKCFSKTPTGSLAALPAPRKHAGPAPTRADRAKREQVRRSNVNTSKVETAGVEPASENIDT